MKYLYFLLIGFVVCSNVSAQNIVFASAPFKSTVLAASTTNTIAYDINDNPMRVDTNNDNQISYTEAANVYSLRLGNISPIIYNLNGIEHFVNLRWLDITASRVTQTNLAALIPNLQYLYCSAMGIFVSDINISGLNLKVLEGSTNAAMAPYFNGTSPYGSVSQFTNLETLGCGNNGLTTLDIGTLTHLKSLSCGNNSLTTLDLTHTPLLETLYCTDNLLTNLNITGCNALNDLRITNNKFTSLTISDKPLLTYMTLSPNPLLTNLNFTNNGLETLNADSCALTTVTLAGTALKYFYCLHNQLTSLDLTSVPNLTNLSCGFNLFTTLDVSGCTKLTNLDCNNNNLSTLFMKNGVLSSQFGGTTISNNPALEYICCDDDEITAIQQLAGINCNVNSYCSFVPGGSYNTIQGTNKFDNNNNGCDASDLMFKNLKLKLTNSSGQTLGYSVSNGSGNYSVPLQTGTFTITPQIENAGYFLITPPTSSVNFSNTPNTVTQNFCFRPNGSRSDIGIYIFPMVRARPGFDATYKIVYKNKGNKTQSGAINFTFNDALLDFVLAIPTVANQSLNTLSWNYSNLLPFETREINLTLNVNTPMDVPPVSSGTFLSFNAAITDDGTDLFPDDNTNAYNQMAVNSFDPNDKTCLEGTTITPEMVGKDVNYLIRFENTGTASAENIVVKDIIDTTKYDISTLIPISGSHPFATKITNPNKVEFIFENINLPFDDANNDGYVAFKIKTKPTLVMGDSFSNSASIYFDYNFPIITDPAVTTIALLANADFTFEEYFKIYPNPVKDIINIDKKKNIAITSFNIYNTLGQIVLAIPNAQQTKSIDVSSLKTGNYVLKINSDKGSSSVKFVKM